MKRVLTIIGLLLAILVVAYMLGPRSHFDAIPNQKIALSSDLVKLERSLAESERKAKLRPDNEARIVWADSNHKVKTPYSLVYIHGFSASWAEGDPIHKQLAKHFGANLYLARTAQHGIDSPDAFQKLTPANYVASAERALAVGKALGQKVVVIGTSAGGMLALYLAARHPEIDGLILYSPCIATANPALKLVTKPWGRQILQQVFNGDYASTIGSYNTRRADYWYSRYHIDGLITLQTMLDEYMTPDEFRKVKQPVFMGYYYKDEEHQDKTVSVPAMLTMFDELGTPAGQKQKMAFPNAGEHVISSHFTSGDLDGVYRASEKFMADVLKMPPATPAQSTVAFRASNVQTKK